MGLIIDWRPEGWDNPYQYPAWHDWEMSGYRKPLDVHKNEAYEEGASAMYEPAYNKGKEEGKAEAEMFHGQRDLLASSLRNLLIHLEVLNTEVKPNGPELIMATEEYIQHKPPEAAKVFEKRFDDIDGVIGFLKDYMCNVGGFNAWVGWCPQDCTDADAWLLKMKDYMTIMEMQKALEEMREQTQDGEVPTVSPEAGLGQVSPQAVGQTEILYTAVLAVDQRWFEDQGTEEQVLESLDERVRVSLGFRARRLKSSDISKPAPAGNR